MFSLYRVIPEFSRIRLPADSGPSRDSTPASFQLPVPWPGRRSRLLACSCKRNVIRRRDHAALFPAEIRCSVYAAIDAACALRLSNPPMPYAGEA